MLRAYLENLPEGIISSKNQFKTYAFANPMVGNEDFSNEYTVQFAMKNTSFSIVNSKDFVTLMPLTYSEERLISLETISSVIFDWENAHVKEKVRGATVRKVEPAIRTFVKYSGSLLERKISKEVGKVSMPDYRKDVNYAVMQNRIELAPFEYPLVPMDSLNIQDTLVVKEERYKKEPVAFQHKPYNYYVAVLRKYFQEDYENLEVKVLPENL